MGRSHGDTGGWVEVAGGGWVRVRRRMKTGSLVERVLAIANTRCDDTRLASSALRAFRAALGSKHFAERARAGSKTPATCLLNAARVTKRLASSEEDLWVFEQLLRAAGSVEVDARIATTADRSAHENKEMQKVKTNEATSHRNANIELGVFLCQQGRDDEASVLLTDLGFRYRLAKSVLRYPDALSGVGKGKTEKTTSKESINSQSSGDGFKKQLKVPVRAFDDAIPDAMLMRLRSVFAPDSRFWQEHGYHKSECGFFSYAHDLVSDDKIRNTLMDFVVRRVQEVASHAFPDAQHATCAEWWVHSRVHSAGHQMHFDSDDEGLVSGGTIRHPICSVVLFITGGVGGPTLVTDQRDDSKQLAKNGWLIAPVSGRTAVFDGECLHGVIPGRGVVDGSSSKRKKVSTSEETQEPRRVTLMVAFWRELEIRGTLSRSKSGSGTQAQGSFPKGSARPFPVPETFTKDPSVGESKEEITWPNLFRSRSGDEVSDDDDTNYSYDDDQSWHAKEVQATKTDAVWEDVDHENNKKCFPSLSVNDMRSLPTFDKCFMF